MKAMQRILRVLFNKRTLSFVLGVGLLCYAVEASALAEVSVSSITGHVNTALQGIGSLLTSVALIAGIGFILVSFFKFHQHKLNPTQVPMSQGITLLVIGACLTVFPSLIKTPASAVLGKGKVTSFSTNQLNTV